jgi:hypothetical protein
VVARAHAAKEGAKSEREGACIGRHLLIIADVILWNVQECVPIIPFSTSQQVMSIRRAIPKSKGLIYVKFESRLQSE